MLHLILGKDWTANTEEVLNRISKDVADRKENRILMVPELISHEMERKLCAAAGDTASRYAQVLSFSRLASRVTESVGNAAISCLDNGGRVVAMAAAARQLSSKLKSYAAVETKPEFLSGLIDAVDEFKRCCITAQDLMQASLQAQGSLAQKLEELSLLMEAYDALCAQGKRDPRDQMTFLLELLEQGNFAKEHVFYIDGFPDFTRQNFAIIEHLIRESPSVTVSLNCDEPGSSMFAFEKAAQTASELLRSASRLGVAVTIDVIEERNSPLKPMRQMLFQGNISEDRLSKQLHVYQADSSYQASVHAAQRILDLVQQGNRYRDISVVCGDMGSYQRLLSLVFRRFHIPLYLTGTEDVLQESVVCTVLNALEAALSGFEQRDTLRYLRSSMAPLSPDICDLVENYAIIWSVRGQKWTQEWKWHPDGLAGEWDEASQAMLRHIDLARQQAIEPLIKLRKNFLDAPDVKRQVLAVYGFLTDIGLGERLEQWAAHMDAEGDNRNAQILNQLWDILMRALEQLYDVLGNTAWEPEHFVRLLRLLLSQYDVGTIPPVLDAVHVGPVTAMRCNQQKYLIVLGAEEGALPGYSGSSGILTDQERVALRKMGVPLTGGALEGIQSEFAEIYGVFCGAQEKVWVYSASEQPSFIFRRLSQLSGSVHKADPEEGFAGADAFEAGAYLAACHGKAEAQALQVQESYEQVKNLKDFSFGQMNQDTVRSLYGNTINLSASQIDRQAECRMSYFLKYGLRIKERKEAEVDPAEFGTYVHAVLENTARCVRELGGFHTVSLEQTMEIAHRFSDEYAAERFGQLQSERITYLFKRNIQELDMIIEELWQELKESLFAPAGFEVNFGGNGELPPIPIPNGSIRAMLRGFVDRVDTWQTAGSTYYRVVDYKTGKKDFDYCDIYNGVGLQMLLYLFALRDSGSDMFEKKAIPAGVQYFPARAPYLSADGRLEAEEAQKERLSQWKRRGLLLEDEAVLQAMEPGDNPSRMCYSVKKDGTLSGDLADRDQLKMLEEFVFRLLADMVSDIASGNVEPNPYTRGSSHNACAFCPYGSICHEKEVEGRRNYQAMQAKRFWEEIGKEQQKNGR